MATEIKIKGSILRLRDGAIRQTLTAENVEVDMETLRLAKSPREHPLVQRRALEAIRDAVIAALYPEDRERLEAYEKEET